jgi:transcriptional regulator with XRE-family HTH domain
VIPPETHAHWPNDPDHAFVARFLGILRESRIAQGLSIREVAKKAGVDHGIIARADRLERIPNLITLRRWVRALDLDWMQVYEDADQQD